MLRQTSWKILGGLHSGVFALRAAMLTDLYLTLRNPIDGRPAESRLLAVGLFGVLGQMPTVLSFNECAQQRQRLREMTSCSVSPILVLNKTIQTCHDEMRR
jgi:hypothetical protein